MATPGNIVQASTPAPENIPILVVTPHPEDLASLKNILHHRDWNLSHCSTVQDARHCLTTSPHSIVVTERLLCDGAWTDVLDVADAQGQPPLVLVTSRHADEQLWAEVLNLGGYDLILKPFDPLEVTRVFVAAWRSWVSALRRSVATTGRFSSQVA